MARRLSTPDLIEMCRVLRHYLGAGLTLRDVFRQQARSGPAAVRAVANRISASVDEGNDLQEALKNEADVFPALFISMISVAEHSGMLPEVFQDLERYYTRQLKIRRDFIASITWPVIQLILGVIIIALMVLVLGMIAESRPGSEPFDPLGLGLLGPRGAMVIIGGAVGIAAGIFGAYYFVTRVLRKQSAVDGFFLKQPVIGPCMRSLALARFCMALRLTTETGMSITNALKLTLKATSNGAFEKATDIIVGGVRKGSDLTTALKRSGLFPLDFLHIMEVAEESGTLSEVMRRQTEHYDEEAGRRLATLASVAGYAVWFMVGGIMVWTIFRIFMSYIAIIEKMMH